MSEVAILGSGPAALLSALAYRQITGENPDIYSQFKKSEMFGAMYLHQPIPLLNDPDAPDHAINVLKIGTRQGYAWNVYGDRDAPCSWDNYMTGTVWGWSLPKTYDVLWNMFQEQTQVDLKADDIPDLCTSYRYVFSAVPATKLCKERHSFFFQDIWVYHGQDDPELKDQMHYSGANYDSPGESWYRYSRISGYVAYEFSRMPEDIAPDDIHLTLSEGVKPIRNDCTCFNEYLNFIRIGRFGEWRKGVLTHHAYRDALDTLSQHALF